MYQPEPKPVDTDTEMYLLSTGECISIIDILARCNEKWGDSYLLESLSIEAISIRTRGYTDNPDDQINYEQYIRIAKK